MKISQREKIEEQFRNEGYVTLPWLIKQYITRGAAIICTMRKEGWTIKTSKPEGSAWAIYTLISLPKAEQDRLL